MAIAAMREKRCRRRERGRSGEALYRMSAGAACLAPALVGFVQPSAASMPVPRAIEGCVKSGVLWSRSHGRLYPIRIRTDLGGADVSLSRFEGKRIRYDHGDLLPGDVYVARSAPVLLGGCR